MQCCILLDWTSSQNPTRRNPGVEQGVEVSEAQIETHPVQTPNHAGKNAACPKVVTMRAYEVYCHFYSPQEKLVTGDCRGGFSTGELIAFLYAHSFPKEEWCHRVNEAFKGMKCL